MMPKALHEVSVEVRSMRTHSSCVETPKRMPNIQNGQPPRIWRTARLDRILTSSVRGKRLIASSRSSAEKR